MEVNAYSFYVTAQIGRDPASKIHMIIKQNQNSVSESELYLHWYQHPSSRNLMRGLKFLRQYAYIHLSAVVYKKNWLFS